jgi:hypothetical protein
MAQQQQEAHLQQAINTGQNNKLIAEGRIGSNKQTA